MPDLLSRVVFELTQTHLRETKSDDGEPILGSEPPLLYLLEKAIASDTAGAHGGGGTRTGAPVDLGAMEIWNGIAKTINDEWPFQGDLARHRMPLIGKLMLWQTHAPSERLLELCVLWKDQIRELLEPTKRVPMRNTTCPHCGWDKVAQETPDGSLSHEPAILMYPNSNPPKAECRVCTRTWEGGELLDLKASLERNARALKALYGV